MNKKTVLNARMSMRFPALMLGIVLLASSGTGAGFPATLDTFDDAGSTSLNTPRIVVTDAAMGGASTGTPDYQDGILRMEGNLSPARGQPGFVSLVLLLDPQGAPQSLDGYDGIEIRVRLITGTLSVQAASAAIQNFDYHALPVSRSKEFHTVRIPFRKMKRQWSEQVALDPATLTSINFVAAGVQAGAFLYEIDAVGFYKN
jgi:hypothetical protein